MVEITDANYEEARKRVYKYNSTDPVFLEAQSVIKYQSRRVGSLQGWNTRYRQKIEVLKQAASETELLHQQLQTTKKALVQTLQNKTVLEAEYDVALTELEKIDDRLRNLKRSYQLVTTGEGPASLQDRWAMLLQAIKDLLFPPTDEPAPKSALPASPENDSDAWASDTIENIQRSLRENR